MIKKIILLTLGLLPLLLHAQITVNAQLPPAGLVQKDQLWNLVVVNNTETVLYVNVKMTLQDNATGEPVLSAITGTIILDKGVKLITGKDAEPVTYNYSAPEYAGNFLPVGIYTACYELVTSVHGEAVVGSDCVPVTIDPLSPPILNAPLDNSDVQTPYPQFSWMPPTPLDMFTSLSYDIIVTEVLPGQSPSESIQYNLPLYTKSNILQTTDNYPSSYSGLDTGKIYAWQIIARNGISYAAKTDVWTFKISGDQQYPNIVTITPFIQLSSSSTEKGVAPDGILKISYYNADNEKNIKVTLIDPSNESGTGPATFSVTGVRGENYIEYDLKKVMQVKEGKIYVAEIVNDKNEKQSVRFVVKYYKN
jgi:hypothetical protein